MQEKTDKNCFENAVMGDVCFRMINIKCTLIIQELKYIQIR